VDLGEAGAFGAGSCILRLPALPSAAAVTRRYLKQLLTSWNQAALIDTAQIVASELVANAVTAAQAPDSGGLLDGRWPGPQPIELTVRRSNVSVIIEVRDPSPNPPVLRQAGPADEGGRGLLLVDILGTRWGHYATGHGGKVVWCEIGIPPANES